MFCRKSIFFKIKTDKIIQDIKTSSSTLWLVPTHELSLLFLPQYHSLIFFFTIMLMYGLSYLSCFALWGCSLKMEQWWAISLTMKGMYDPTSTKQSEALDVYFNLSNPCGSSYKAHPQHISLVLFCLYW